MRLPASGLLMERNLRILPWWWVLRWTWLGEGIWVLYLTDARGLTLGEVVLFESLLGLSTIIGEVPTGMLADRYGRRLSIALGSVAVVIAFLAFGTATAFWLLLASYAFFGLAEAFFSGADSAMLFDSLKAVGRDEDFATWEGRLNALITGAIALLTVIGSVMVRWTPLSTPIILSALLSIPAIGLALALREPPRSDEARRSYLETGREAAARVARSPALMSLMLLMAVTTFAIALMAITLPIIVVDAYHLPVWSVGVFVAGHMAAASLGGIVAGRLGRRLTLRRLFWVVPVGSALSLLAGATGQVWLYPFFIFPNFAWNAMWPHFADYVSRRVPDGLRATTISIANVIANLGYALVTPVLGLGIDGLGLRATLLIAALAFAATALVAYLAWLRAGDLGRSALPAVDAPSAPAVP